MLQILFALLAGVLTVASPCILPLLPILLGVSVGQTSKLRPLFIVLGFVLSFAVIGIILAVLSHSAGFDPNILRRVAVFLLAIFGLLMLWPKPFEYLTMRMNGLINRVNTAGARAGTGNGGGFILGLTLGVVWTPCAGPVLGAILTLVAAQREIVIAGILLLAYAIGAGIPMLLIAYGGQYATTKVRWLSRYTRALQVIFGLIIILLAIALYYNYDTQIYAALLRHYPSFNPKF